MAAQSARCCCLLLTVLGLGFMQTAGADTHYVSLDGGNVSPYTNGWTSAATTIQAAINQTAVNDTVLVSNGVYQTGGTVINTLTNRVYISQAIIVRSLNNDPVNTIIKGAWASDGQTNGLDAIRCVYMQSGSSLIGFTLTNGATATSSAITGGRGVTGGGVYTPPGINTIVSNCIIVGNASRGDSSDGPGGGGAANGSFFNCLIKDNVCHIRGGGGAGGCWNVVLSNCTIVGNQSFQDGGGVTCGTLYNCLVYSNTAPRGGGVSAWSAGIPAWAYNCTIINNQSPSGGGVGCFNLQVSVYLTNCISWSNSTADAYVSAVNSCGVGNNYTNTLLGNTTNNPMFVDYGKGNYRLQAASPCVNSGTNQAWMTGAADLDGRPRIRYGRVDMGAYEAIYRGAIFKFR